jgi:hypothetical protein
MTTIAGSPAMCYEFHSTDHTVPKAALLLI